MKRNGMRVLIYLVVVVCCDAGRITRGLEYDLFPNFKSVYHGHGATSYQNVQIESHGSIPIPKHYSKLTYTPNHLHHPDAKEHNIALAVLPTKSHSIIEHYGIATPVPYIDNHEDHVIIEEAISPQYHDSSYEHHQEYEYQLH